MKITKKTVKRILFLFLSIIVVSALWGNYLLSFQSVQAAKSKQVKLSKESVELTVNQSVQLKLVGSKGKLNWKTKDSSIAIVKNGKVTAIEVGKTKIFVKYNNKEYSCKVTVKNKQVIENGEYTNKEDVSIYISQFAKLPSNYITKAKARELGWEGGSLEPYAPGKSIGGDYFGNYEGLLPDAYDRSYYECDIDTKGAISRGSKRIVYSNDGLIYFTEDHYNTFILLLDNSGGTK